MHESVGNNLDLNNNRTVRQWVKHIRAKIAHPFLYPLCVCNNFLQLEAAGPPKSPVATHT